METEILQMNKGYKDLADRLEADYGVGAVVAPVEAVLWAGADLVGHFGFEPAVVKGQISALNRVRERHGKIPVYAPYGSELF